MTGNEDKLQTNLFGESVEIENWLQERRFELTSLLHKEVRRNDANKAVNAGYWVGRARGEEYVKTYCRSICLEETRNRNLLEQYQNLKNLNWQAAVKLLTISRKTYDSPIFSKAACEKYRAMWYAEPITLADEIQPRFTQALESGNLLEIYRVHFGCLHGTPSIIKKAYRKLLTERLQEKGDGEYAVLCKYDNEAELGILERVIGISDPRANEFNPVRDDELEIDEKTIPIFPPYTFDAHTRIGKHLLKSNVQRIRPGIPLPPEVDLRWAGSYIGEVWRSLRVLQGKDRNCQWEEVKWPDDLWQMVTQWESEFIKVYNRFIWFRGLSTTHQNKYGIQNLFL